MVRFPTRARCCVCSSERPHQLCGSLGLLATGTADLSRRYNAPPLTAIHSGPIPLLPPIRPNGTKRRNFVFSGASAGRAHKVAIRPVIQLPDVAHPDESVTAMLWQTGDDGHLHSCGTQIPAWPRVCSANAFWQSKPPSAHHNHSMP